MQTIKGFNEMEITIKDVTTTNGEDERKQTSFVLRCYAEGTSQEVMELIDNTLMENGTSVYILKPSEYKESNATNKEYDYELIGITTKRLNELCVNLLMEMDFVKDWSNQDFVKQYNQYRNVFLKSFAKSGVAIFDDDEEDDSDDLNL